MELKEFYDKGLLSQDLVGKYFVLLEHGVYTPDENGVEIGSPQKILSIDNDHLYDGDTPIELSGCWPDLEGADFDIVDEDGNSVLTSKPMEQLYERNREPLKNAAFIKAFADGYTVQCWTENKGYKKDSKGDGWELLATLQSVFLCEWEMRIKPKEPEKKKLTMAELTDIVGEDFELVD